MKRGNSNSRKDPGGLKRSKSTRIGLGLGLLGLAAMVLMRGPAANLLNASVSPDPSYAVSDPFRPALIAERKTPFAGEEQTETDVPSTDSPLLMAAAADDSNQEQHASNGKTPGSDTTKGDDSGRPLDRIQPAPENDTEMQNARPQLPAESNPSTGIEIAAEGRTEGRATTPPARTGRLADPAYRQQRAAELRRRNREAHERARAWAERTGSPMRIEIDGTVSILVDYTEEHGPIYRATRNVNAAISTGANLVQESPYNLSGAGITAGIWDGGNVRTTHTEFVSGRVENFDNASLSDHATHVAGTMIARGADATAKGMAPEASLFAYDFYDDLTDMTLRAMADPTNTTGKIQLSNHSYGYLAGWAWHNISGNLGWHWFGTWAPDLRESAYFGLYYSPDRDLDELVYDAVYYLPFKAAGNDRNDSPPSAETTFYYYNNGAWTNKLYDPATDPLADYQKGGYNTIPYGGVAKNILLVGAVNDAVTSGERDLSKASQAWFSSWGPTDDGRIKPDIVANGVALRSSSTIGDTNYNSKSGTSMATPNASGSAILLLEHYDNLFPGQAMWASTLKALIIHTADSLDDPGPDYRNGWGLMNTPAAVNHLTDHASNPDDLRIIEYVIYATNTMIEYSVYWDGESPFRATLAWTDPPGEPVLIMNATNRMLVNDLDLRIIDPNGTTNYPWVLDFSNPSNAATTGDNVLDVVEQVEITDPPTTGVYRLQVSYKDTLTDGEQHFSLIISGSSAAPVPIMHSFEIHSAFGEPVPGTGTYTFAAGTVLTNSIGPITSVTDGHTRYEADGWQMSGNDPSAGSKNSFIMTITNDAVLSWQWPAEAYHYGVSAAPGGSVTGTTNGWYAPGTIVSNTATPLADYRLRRWEGVAPELVADNPLVFALTNAHPGVVARFITLRPEGVVIQIIGK